MHEKARNVNTSGPETTKAPEGAFMDSEIRW